MVGSTLDIFSPSKLGPLQLPNRVVMAPMTRNRAGRGNVPGPLNATYYAQRASAGLIISEATQISPQGVGYPGTPGIHSAEQIAGCIFDQGLACVPWRPPIASPSRTAGSLFSTSAA